MTSLLTIPSTNPSPQWQPATWADYERSRDGIVEGTGRYQEIDISIALMGLPIDLLTQTLAQLSQGMSNSKAAQWFGTQISPAV
jgi:hypothetical protein